MFGSASAHARATDSIEWRAAVLLLLLHRVAIYISKDLSRGDGWSGLMSRPSYRTEAKTTIICTFGVFLPTLVPYLRSDTLGVVGLDDICLHRERLSKVGHRVGVGSLLRNVYRHGRDIDRYSSVCLVRGFRILLKWIYQLVYGKAIKQVVFTDE
ncbi:hypothetical protein F4782DRAFT_508825 [Xylaria castorea]|nr:hypothetical protein F4782DRAFT_508825 [Xylaria castorea]